MEYVEEYLDSSLNPYFNGIYFLMANSLQLTLFIVKSLNPYFNGIYFLIRLRVF